MKRRLVGRRGPVRRSRAGPDRGPGSGRGQAEEGRRRLGAAVQRQEPERLGRPARGQGPLVGEGRVHRRRRPRRPSVHRARRLREFRLPIEAMISDGGNSGQYFRTRDRQGLSAGPLRGPDQRHPRRPAANRQPVQHRQDLQAEAQAERVVHAGSHRRRRPHHHHRQRRDRGGHARLESTARDIWPSSSTTRAASSTSARRRSRSCRRARRKRSK